MTHIYHFECGLFVGALSAAVGKVCHLREWYRHTFSEYSYVLYPFNLSQARKDGL